MTSNEIRWPDIQWDNASTSVLFNPRTPQIEVREIEQRLQTLQPLDSHVWIATSGSTAQVAGQLKWVALSKAALLSSAAAVNQHLSSTASDVWVHVLPTFHVGGVGIFARAHLSGARVVCGLSETNGRWDPYRFHEICVAHAGTLSALVPTQVYDLVQARLPAPASLRAIIVGGAALSSSLFMEARKLGWPLLPSYGMTETCSQIATASLASWCTRESETLPNELPLPKLLSHAEVQLSSEGKIQVRASSLLTGFAILNHERDQWIDPKQEGWFQAEDLGEIIQSPAGKFLRIRGRTSDFIKVGGESVDLTRLASILTEARAAEMAQTDLVILPIADNRLGSVIHGVVATGSEFKTSQSESVESAIRIFERFNSRVLPFERVRMLYLVPSIPRSSLQKLLKAPLMEMLIQAPSISLVK
jgi:O-succinylbenzoic acid--CoA ligase